MYICTYAIYIPPLLLSSQISIFSSRHKPQTAINSQQKLLLFFDHTDTPRNPRSQVKIKCLSNKSPGLPYRTGYSQLTPGNVYTLCGYGMWNVYIMQCVCVCALDECVGKTNLKMTDVMQN
eukprot:TRINITY_DN18848_c0_g1_i1.p1 TRINITY_DN18848_c0_g1~~TRINITY_DN18848_c0_g1_i1.p1  ORF type:complete len:121 (-),score=5.37 TRINITY_DN18848_c0_g1_i1:1044-1406(-)